MIQAQGGGGPGPVFIEIRGRFDYSCHREFRAAFESAPKGTDIVVDLTGVDYMDSAALGMLLLLKDHAGDGARVTVRTGHAQPREVLRIAHFDQFLHLV